ncbi:phosphoribosylanthranilate isomerase [Radiobacillus kanasensis]|uniref:phosphoribosylanthranilate isomerase n=1 Tax=Radiobacillus kanasensis TaxID=2844358 RepID=UPI001E5ED471|nr:phosphoribosylanthranilate isomerase [Radiobacillus kanasensis]UFT99066.1 phosphoribosylanthranilate isomerase [Radiobacillus kanasensis]
MKVKICGIKTVEAAKAVVESGADFIGFVFADSKRMVTKEEAKEIADTLPSSIQKVGVFVNEEPEVVQEIATYVGLDYVQLHGDETPAYCEQIKVPMIKAFQVRSKEDLQTLERYNCDYYLLDSPAGKYRGGNGETFDWSLAKGLANLEGKIMLAGGLHAENVAEAIREVYPVGVDISSGVETDGSKDPDKIYAFVKAAKNSGR